MQIRVIILNFKRGIVMFEFISNHYHLTSNLFYLINSEHRIFEKFRILLVYFRISLKQFFLPFSKSENFLNLKISTFQYDTFKFLFEEIFLRNEYYFKNKKSSPIILDCGANIGLATVFFKFICPSSRIFSFEPDKQTFKLLKKNIAQNRFSDVTLVNAAVSDSNGLIDFYVGDVKKGALNMSTKSERNSKNKITVKSISLSEFIKEHFKDKKIDFLKMDIEGAEVEVISDLHHNGVLKNIEQGVIEYHHKSGETKSQLSSFLKIFEAEGFEYQISAFYSPLSSSGKYQDILLKFYKPKIQ